MEAKPRFITSRRKHLIMLYAGHRLYQQSVADVIDETGALMHSEITYFCRKTKCKKKFWMKIDIGATEQVYDRETIEGHNGHDGDPLEIEVDVVHKALELAHQNPVASNRSIVAAAIEGIPDEVLFMVDMVALRRRVGLFKKTLYAPGQTDPTSLSIPDVWRVHVDGTAFVMFDSGATAGRHRIIVMSSLWMIEKFSQCTSIAGDGTFYSRPDGWHQIYTWHLRLKNTFLPSVTVFMGQRTERTYSQMLQVIAGIIQQYFGREWIVESVMTDFEPAIHLAIRRHFGSQVVHKACFFHYSYSLTKKIRKLGLKKKCNSDPAFNQYIREFRIFPLLLPNHVLASFDDLSNLALPHRQQFANVPRLIEFLQYMHQTWIGGLRESGEILLPRFPMNIWNHKIPLMQDNPRTTSVLESWHRTINAEIRKKKAHKYWSIHCVIRDELFVHSKSRFLCLFSVLDGSAQRKPTLQGFQCFKKPSKNSTQVNYISALPV